MASAQLNVFGDEPITTSVNFADNDLIEGNVSDNFIRLSEEKIQLVGEADLDNLPTFPDFGIQTAKLFFDYTFAEISLKIQILN